jgi:DNA-binding PadR family transcriptional regulator
MIVSLLSSSAKNGVELMDGIESMTRGWWRPTPGSIYPLLARMTEEGTVKKRNDGRYELTSKARREIEVSFGPPFSRPRTTESTIAEIESLASYLEDAKNLGTKELGAQKAKLDGLAKRFSDLAESGG